MMDDTAEEPSISSFTVFQGKRFKCFLDFKTRRIPRQNRHAYGTETRSGGFDGYVFPLRHNLLFQLRSILRRFALDRF